ncbi:MAG: 16S rRNA (cytidine(1402)-2'-O)-methyltransferase [Planctomycetes bacterium]|nr:16S rRNA (cytidine(1402)-2'-O)-methyltransferase [Planctomycetota bacterium]
MSGTAGVLWVVATPIGNLEDVTLRAMRVLREADLVVAEDTRVTSRLLARIEVSRPLLSCFEHSEERRLDEIVDRLRRGERIALVTDAGTPGICDPGAELVRRVVEAGVPVVPVPGPCAAAAALSASGFPADRFVLEGFLPRKGRERAARLAALARETRTVVLYEAPHRIRETLDDLAAVLGERPAALFRELTKLHEEAARGPLAELAAAASAREPRGEYVLVISGAPPIEVAPADDASIGAALRDAVGIGQDRKAAIRDVADRLRVPRREVYRIALEVFGGGEREHAPS